LAGYDTADILQNAERLEDGRGPMVNPALVISCHKFAPVFGTNYETNAVNKNFFYSFVAPFWTHNVCYKSYVVTFRIVVIGHYRYHQMFSVRIGMIDNSAF